MTVNRRAIVAIAPGLGLALAGCMQPTSPSQHQPKATAKLTVSVSSVTKATLAPEEFGYAVRLQLADSGGVPSTVTEVSVAFDTLNLNETVIKGDQLGQTRRLAANGTLDLELTCVPAWGYVGDEQYATVAVWATDDNGYRVSGFADTAKIVK